MNGKCLINQGFCSSSNNLLLQLLQCEQTETDAFGIHSASLFNDFFAF